MKLLSIEEGACALSQGKVIAYPTEAVFGLGCCPKNTSALNAIIRLKERSPHKGMILIASEITQILPYIDTTDIPEERMSMIQSQWPGPFTWVFPASKTVSGLIKGQFTTVAVRVTAHPIAKALCQAFKGAVVSTSANLSSNEPLRRALNVYELFGDSIAGIVEGEVGGALKATTIQHALTGEILRA